jgi:quercetin dioxygenase-like cupin family protein
MYLARPCIVGSIAAFSCASPQIANRGASTGARVVTATPSDDRINGERPPMTPTKSYSSKRMTDAAVLDAKGAPTGFRILSHQILRKAGTRAPIHMHLHGGQTCVVSGEMTLYLVGAAPQVAKPGDCYWMPAGKRMTGVNTGATDASLIDTFVVPAEDRIWIVVEPGQEGDQDQFNAHE